MAELYGKVTGTSKGMGGSMHIFSKEKVLEDMELLEHNSG
jgi:TPP-dependent pyruvate/acetoin dehydrogenase alpha subunit